MTLRIVIVLRGMVEDVHVIELLYRRPPVVPGPGVCLVLHQNVRGDAHRARVIQPGSRGVLTNQNRLLDYTNQRFRCERECLMMTFILLDT